MNLLNYPESFQTDLPSSKAGLPVKYAGLSTKSCYCQSKGFVSFFFFFSFSGFTDNLSFCSWFCELVGQVFCSGPTSWPETQAQLSLMFGISCWVGGLMIWHGLTYMSQDLCWLSAVIGFPSCGLLHAPLG